MGDADRAGAGGRPDRVGRRATVGAPDRGSAAIEFVTVGVLLLVPLVYLAVALARVQAGTLAADAGARAAVRALTAADTEEQGRARAAAAARWALHDQGFDDRAGDLRLRCDAAACLRPGAGAEARMSVEVHLPGVPAGVPAHVTVRARAVATVDEFRAPG